MALRQSFPIFVVLVVAWLMRDKISALDFMEIRTTITEISFFQWYIAACATYVSFWAIGRYDEVVHGMLQTGVSHDEARIGGTTAVAISQFAGFGALTASLVRWRMLNDITLLSSLKISAVVTVSFLIGWAFATSALSLVTFGQSLIPTAAAVGIVLVGICLVIAPSCTARLPSYFPTSLAMLKIVALVSIDVGFAAVALFVLLPTGTDINFLAFVVAFSVALVAGLVSGTPGGIGAFELCLLSQLPGLGQEPLVAAALGFRLIYHLLPALLAGLMLIKGPPRESSKCAVSISRPRVPNLPPRVELALWNSPFAEAKLLRHGEFGLLNEVNRPKALVAQLGQSLTMLSGALDTADRPSDLIDNFNTLARQQSRTPTIYKATPRMAYAARKKGWKALKISQEARINVKEFSREGSSKRQLRRMLRKAEQAGIEIHEVGRSMPEIEMAAISSKWTKNYGSERGFSMGVFDLDCARYQRIFTATDATGTVGFITLHESKDQWTLDLMRSTDRAPAGVMHALVCGAIDAAQLANVPCVSLAASQVEVFGPETILGKLERRMVQKSNGAGLARFKSCFAPTWSPRYFLAPSKIGIILGLLDITLKIHQARPHAQVET